MLCGAIAAARHKASAAPRPGMGWAVSLPVTRFEFGDYLRPGQAFDLEQQQGVVQQVGRLADDFHVRLCDCGESQLQSFFADLLRDSQRTLGQQLRGIAALGSRGDSIRDAPLELRHEAALLGGRSRRLFPPASGLPLWQAGPLGSARINKASPSQSAAISLSLRKWPEVSPLVHSRPLLRLQKVTRPVACVAARASRFMYPSMRTAPLPASWTTAGSKPPPLSQSSFAGCNGFNVVPRFPRSAAAASSAEW